MVVCVCVGGRCSEFGHAMALSARPPDTDPESSANLVQHFFRELFLGSCRPKSTNFDPFWPILTLDNISLNAARIRPILACVVQLWPSSAVQSADAR